MEVVTEPISSVLGSLKTMPPTAQKPVTGNPQIKAPTGTMARSPGMWRDLTDLYRLAYIPITTILYTNPCTVLFFFLSALFPSAYVRERACARSPRSLTELQRCTQMQLGTHEGQFSFQGFLRTMAHMTGLCWF